MQAFECTGLWWLPGQEAARVAGILRVSAGGNLHLSIVGSFGAVGGLTNSINLPTIVGSVDKSPSGNHVTLTGCVLTKASIGTFVEARETYQANWGLFGAHLLDGADFGFKYLTLQIGGLTEWASALRDIRPEQPPQPKAGEKDIIVRYSARPPVSGTIPGGKASVFMNFQSLDNIGEFGFRESANLEVTCEMPKTADELNADYVYPLQNLMTFVCDRAQEVQLFGVRPESAAPNPANADIRVIGPRVKPEDDGEPVHAYQMLFTLQDVQFADFVGKWIHLTDQYADVCNIYFGLKYGPPAYIDMSFVSIVQCLHLYHARREDGAIRRAKEERRLREIVSALTPTDAEWVIGQVGARPYPAFEGVLRELVNQHGTVMGPLTSDRQEGFINEVMSTLHYVIHREAEVYGAASHGADLYWLMEKLRFLIKTCFLSELGFSEQKILSLFERNAIYQHVRGLEAAREARLGALSWTKNSS